MLYKNTIGKKSYECCVWMAQEMRRIIHEHCIRILTKMLHKNTMLTASDHPVSSPSLRPRRRNDEKTKGPQSGESQRIRLSMTRRPLNGLFRRAVQCRDQSVVNRLHDRSHPNKVSMKRRKEERQRAGGRGGLYTLRWSRESALVASEIWQPIRLRDMFAWLNRQPRAWSSDLTCTQVLAKPAEQQAEAGHQPKRPHPPCATGRQHH